MLVLENKKFIEKYFKALSGEAKTPELIARFVDDRELADHIIQFERSFPNYELFIDHLITEDEWVAVRARFKGVHRGDFMGIPPTEKALEMPFNVWYRIENEMITGFSILWDRLEFMEKLGFMPLYHN